MDTQKIIEKLKKFKHSHPTEIEWGSDWGVLALNLSTMQFENTSMLGQNSVIRLNLFNNAFDYSEDIAELATKYFHPTYLLYTTDLWVVGFVEELVDIDD